MGDTVAIEFCYFPQKSAEPGFGDMVMKERKLPYHKSVETKSKFDFSGGGISTPPVNQIPLKRIRHNHTPYVHLGLSSSARFRLLEANQGVLRLSKDQFSGGILNLSEEGMLISTDHQVPDEGFLLATLFLNQTIILEGILGKIKKVEFLDNRDFLVGVEFLSIEELKEVSSPGEIESLPVNPGNFKQKLQDIINHHLPKDETVHNSKRNYFVSRYKKNRWR